MHVLRTHEVPMTLTSRFRYRWLQFLLLGLSLILTLMAVPAAKAPGLSLHDNSACILSALLFFAPVLLLSSLPVGHVGQYVLSGGFLSAWILQGIALQWIEGVWIQDLLGSSGNAALKLWLATYFGSILVVPVGAMIYHRSSSEKHDA